MKFSIRKNCYSLCMKSTTWAKDSHSLFDYQSPKVTTQNFLVPLSTRNIALYRKRSCCKVLTVDQKEEQSMDPETYQFLTRMEVKPENNSKANLVFSSEPSTKHKKGSTDLQTSEQSICEASAKEEEYYLIVRKQKDALGEPKGCKIQVGQCIKLGRVEFYVSEICVNGLVVKSKTGREICQGGKGAMKYQTLCNLNNRSACKICLQDGEQSDNFLFNPCRCSGSCGTVHFKCLLEWIHFKVRKEVIGGTLHYNFDKLQCEVCRSQLPLLIQTQNGLQRQLIPIQKPKDNYLVLEGISDKTKSLVVIHNTPPEGIKLGRGNQCEIRVTDISVSRNHALIKFINGEFVIFDNKSKFGTLLKQPKLELQISGKVQQGIQIGRTVLTFDLRRNHQSKREQSVECEQTGVEL